MVVDLDWAALGGIAVIMSGHIYLMKLVIDNAVNKLNIKMAEHYVTKKDCQERMSLLAESNHCR